MKPGATISLRSVRFVALYLGLFFLVRSSAFADNYAATPGIPVKMWGSAYGRAVPGPTAQVQLSGNDFLDADGVGTVPLTVNGYSSSTAFVWRDTDVGTAYMEPGKNYTITVSGAFAGGGANDVAIQMAPPVGYEIMIDGVERRRVQTVSSSKTYTVRLEGIREQTYMAAGSSTQLMLARIYWQVGLGGLLNGNPAGAVSIVDPGSENDWSALYTPSSLEYDPPSDEIVVLRDVGYAIRQIIANQSVVDIVPSTSTAYDIKFYHPDQAAGTGTNLRTFTGLPYLNYRVEQGSTATTLKITSTTRDTNVGNGWTSVVVRTAVTTMARVDSGAVGGPTYTWTRSDWNTSGSTQIAEQVTTAAGTTADRTDTVVIRPGGGGTNVSSNARIYHQYSWGEEITSNTAGSSNSTQTTFDYYDDPTQVGRHGFVKSTTSTGGGWEAYDYWDAGSSIATKRVGTIATRYRPFINLPATVTFNATQGEVTDYAYSDDPFGMTTRLASVQTRVNNIVTAKSTTVYSFVAGFKNGAYVNDATRADYVSSGATLTTVTRFYKEDTANLFLRGLTYSVTTPDNVRVSYAYQKGTFDGTTFTPDDNGTCSRIAKITGIAGSQINKYDGCDIMDITMVDGKSTVETVIRDSRALIVRSESYARVSSAWQLISWVNNTYDTFGHLVGTQTSNGATTTSVWSGDQKIYDVDDSGVRTDYDYDAAGRLYHSKKRNVANTAFTTTTTYVYDEAGRSLSETLSSAGTAETIVNSRTYDDAGRIKTETPSGTGLTTHTYDVLNRSHTVITPDTATRTETYLPDGRLEKLEGSAVVASYYIYTVDNTTGQRTGIMNFGTAASPRYMKTWTDWLGRTTRTEKPGFSKSAQPVFVTQYFYDDSTAGLGRLYKTMCTSSAPIYYEYDSLGSLIRTGLDVDAVSNGLTNNSNDRISEQNQFVEQVGTGLWLTTEKKIYPAASAITFSRERVRLTGFSTNRRSETQEWNIEDVGAATPSAITTVDVNFATKSVTSTTTVTGLGTSSLATTVNGLSTSQQSADGLVYTSEYDQLERLWRQKNPRHTTSTGDLGYTKYTYKTGTALVEHTYDPAGNSISFNDYNSMGRVDWMQNAEGKYLRTAYNLRGQAYRQWGDATNPIEYGYDAVFGERTSLSTFRSAASTDSATWPSVGTADTTTWTYDDATGQAWKKTDALGNSIQFDYNDRGMMSSRQWARYLTASGHTTERVTTSYDYYSTGDLWKVSYNDEVEPIPTPDLTYTYDRLGRTVQIDEKSTEGGMGSRTFTYDSTNPWRLSNETLPAGFGSRILTRLYENATAANTGTIGSHIKATLKGRVTGFDLGVAGNTGRDLHQIWTFSDKGRYAAISVGVNGGTPVDFVYAYEANSALMDGYSQGSFSVSRDYEVNRDLVTRVESKYGTTSVARFDYTYDTMGRRSTLKQSGSAYAKYTQGQSYAAIYHRYGYNARGELESDHSYGGDDPTQSTNELTGRGLEYRYDSIGNRKTAGMTGTSNLTVDASGTGDDDYSVNALNQYTAKENNIVRITGVVASNADVAVLNSSSTIQQQDVWSNYIIPGNVSGPAKGSVTAFAAVPAANSPIKTVTANWLVPARQQTFVYDPDGNLASDGLWNYTYDAENRLVRTSSALPSGLGFSRLRVDYRYDYQSRRTEKRVLDLDTSVETLARRFLYDDANLVAEIDANTPTTILRSYAWGLDLVGNPTASGGVGAMIRLTNYSGGLPGASYLPTYDANGNVLALLNAASGAVASTYEYDPYGNIIRNEVNDTSVADNPFRFASKYSDSETGLVYFGLRYYSSAIGRFINRDPFEEEGGVNLYGYCENDAVNNFDYNGMLKWSGWHFEFDDPTQPGFGASVIPVYGAFRSAEYNFLAGNNVRGVLWTLVGASDVATFGLPVRSLVTSVGKVGFGGLVRMGGSPTWNAAKSWMVRQGWRDFKYQQFHHWIPQRTYANMPSWVANLFNQPWNIMRLGTNAETSAILHIRIENSLVQRLLYGVPGWAKAAAASVGSRILPNSNTPLQKNPSPPAGGPNVVSPPPSGTTNTPTTNPTNNSNGPTSGGNSNGPPNVSPSPTPTSNTGGNNGNSGTVAAGHSGGAPAGAGLGSGVGIPSNFFGGNNTSIVDIGTPWDGGVDPGTPTGGGSPGGGTSGPVVTGDDTGYRGPVEIITIETSDGTTVTGTFPLDDNSY